MFSNRFGKWTLKSRGKTGGVSVAWRWWISDITAKFIQITEELKQEIIRLYTEDKIGCAKIGKSLGIGEKRVAKIINESGVMRKPGESNKKYTCNSNFFSELNERSAYWLGVLYADGNISDDRHAVIFSAKDKEWVNAFLVDLEYTGNISREFHKVYQKEIWKVVIRDNQLYEDLVKLGCTSKKSFTIQFPNLSEELIPHFVRGYFDGDGTVSYNYYLKIAQLKL